MGDRTKSEITVTLTHDEALVLLDYLGRSDKAGHPLATHKAEDVALWALECLLEKQLVEVFDPQYSALVERARERLVEGHEK